MQISQENIHQAKLISVRRRLSINSKKRVGQESGVNLLEICDKWIALYLIGESDDVILRHRQSETNPTFRGEELLRRMPAESHVPRCKAQVRFKVVLSAGYLISICLILLATINSGTASKHQSEMRLPSGGLEEESAGASEMIEKQKSMDASPIVQTDTNIFFRGIQVKSRGHDGKEANVIAFLGIRYANPPVKRLRFMPPTDYHYAPNLVHNAQRFGPICWQRWPIDYRTLPTSEGLPNNDDSVEMWLHLTKAVMPKPSFTKKQNLFRRLAAMEQSEDCLNLNIYTPEEAFIARNNNGKPPLPVLVIIHGESFDYGSGSTLNPAMFVKENRIMVITFNYRLNILGFPPKLAGPSRSNLGLLDQVAALLWIKDNIGAFGGAPHNITLMGSKEGAIFVNLLMLSPMAKGLFQRAVMEDGSGLTPLVLNNMNTSPAWANSQPMMQHIRILGQLSNCFPNRKPSLNSSATLADSLQAPEVMASSDSKSSLALLECLKQLPIEQLLTPIPLDIMQAGARSDSLPVIHRRWLQVGSHKEKSEQTGSPTESNLNQLEPINSELLHQLLSRAASQQLQRPDGSEPDELFGAIYLQPSMATMFGPIMDGVIVVGDEVNRVTLSKNSSSLAHKDLLIGLTKPILVDPEVNKVIDSKNNPFTSDQSLPTWISLQLQNSGLTNEQALNLVNKFVRSHYRWHSQEIANSIVAQYLNQANLYVQALDNNINDGTISLEQMLLVALSEAFHDATVNVPVLRTTLIQAMRQVELLSDTFIKKSVEEVSQLPPKGRNINKIDFLSKLQTFVEESYKDQRLALNKPQARSIKATYFYQIDTRPWIRHIEQQVENLDRFRESAWQAIKFRLINLLNIAKQDLQYEISLGCMFHDEQLDSGAHDSYLTFKKWLCSRLGSILGNFIRADEQKIEVEERESSFDFNERLDYFSTRCDQELDLSNRIVDHHLTQAAAGNSSNTSRLASCEFELSSLVLEYLERSQNLGSDWSPFEPISQSVATLPAPSKSLVHMSHISNNQGHKISILSRFSFWTNNIPTLNCSRTQVIQPNLVSGASKGWNSSALLNLNVVFSCQTGAHTYLEVFKRLASSIKQQVAYSLEQLETKKKFDAGLQVNVRASASLMNLTDAESQQVSNHVHQLLVDSTPSDSQSVLTSSVLNEDENRKPVDSRTKHVGSILFVCLFLLAISLIIALKAVKGQRRQTKARRSTKESQSIKEETTLTELNNTSGTSPQEVSPREIGHQISSELSGNQPEIIHGGNDTTFHLEPCSFNEQQEQPSQLSQFHPTHLIVESVCQPRVFQDNQTSLLSSTSSRQTKAVKLASEQDIEHSHQHDEQIFDSWQEAQEVLELPIFNAYHTCQVGDQETRPNDGLGNEKYAFSRSNLKKRVKISDSVATIRQTKIPRNTHRSPSMNQIGDIMYCQVHQGGILNQQQHYCQHGTSSDHINIWPLDETNGSEAQNVSGYYSDALPIYQGEQSMNHRHKMITSILALEEHPPTRHQHS